VVVGLTVIPVPVPADVPPHEPEYHLQLPPVPKLPPVKPNAVLCPKQIVDVPVIAVAGTEVSRTVTVILRQIVLLQVPSALRK